MNYVNTEVANKSIVVPVSVYSRCCGYFSPVFLSSGNGRGTWNKGKLEEYKERKMINIDEFKK